MAVQRDKIIASAEKLVAKGKVEAAIKEYERLLDDNPNDVNTLNRIGDLWVRINRNDEAVKVFSKIADHYSKDGFFLKAIAIYKKINKLDPSKLEVYAKLADLYAKQGLAMEAKSQYQVLADYYLKHGDPGNALQTYRKISELDPNSINVHVKLADLYSQNNQTGEALKEYDRVGRMLLKRGMLDEAVQVFRKALKIDASNIELVESLVSALHDAKNYDSAVQILEMSLEKNRENPRLLALWAKSYIGKGDVASARGVLEKGLAANPADPNLREALGDVYLRQGQPDKAVELMLPAVDAAISANNGRVAVDLLRKVLSVDAANISALTKLVAVYTKLHEETNVLSALNSLAEAHISRRTFAEAAQTLSELIRREPENAQHKTKLAFVQQQLGGGAAPMPAPTPAPTFQAPPPKPEPMPEISFDSGPSLDMEIGLDASEPVDLDLSVGIPDTLPPTQFAPSPVAAETDEETEDLDFITEHLTEAEVFSKYGLSEKAVEHLKLVIERAPRHAPAYDRLLRVYMDEGDATNVRSVADQYLSLLRSKGDFETVQTVESDLAMRGFIESSGAAATPVQGGAVDSYSDLLDVSEVSTSVEDFIRPTPDIEPAPEELSLSDTEAVEEESELEFDLDTMQDEFSAGIAEEEPAPVMTAPVEPLPEETFELPPEPPELPSLDFSMGAEEPSFDLGGVSEPSIDFQPEVGATPVELPAFEPPLTAATPAPEELGEIDFYIEQELFDEAESRLSALAGRFPGDAEVDARQQRLVDARSAAAAPPPVEISSMDVEQELLSAIGDDDDDIKIVSAPRATAESAALEDESSLFADEDDFFDLAAELEDELEEEAANVSLSEEEQSLEDIFKEFKKGVEQQLDSEDYDTHYNLGIAYKEMGLIDEAIGEFQLASKDPKRTIECCSMLGLCFLEKGMPQLAIKWYTKGLEVAEITEEEQLGLMYDLANAYLEVGDVATAQKTFIEIYGINTGYRDVVSRIKQLEDVNK